MSKMNIKKILRNKNKLSIIINILIIFNYTMFFTSWARTIQTGIEVYAEQEFIVDFNKFKVGDFIPKRYLTPEYVIKRWYLRNLPAPDAGTHWIYINENYILINNINSKVYKVYNRDIFYHQQK